MPVVTGTDLVVKYDAEIALDTSSFEIPRGVNTAVIGPNGSGKSTLLNVIAGLIQPTSGRLTLDTGNDRARISYVLQTTKVNESLPITVAEVVAMGRYAGTGAYGRLGRADRRAISVAMERVGITEIAQQSLGALSGGQRQRVFVAQGLAQDHDILLLDEPLTGIDLPTAQAIDGVIHDEIQRGCSVIMTTHDLSEAQVADHVVLLGGRVVANGTPETVISPANLRAAYGAALLHLSDDSIFLDDAAHIPVPGRHVHLDRSIHTQPSHPEDR